MSPSPSFAELVLATIRRRGLLARGDTVLCGVSGGADSVALLRVLLDLAGELGISVRAAHLDHALRPDSDDDAAFVRALAASWQVPLTIDRLRWEGGSPPGSNREATARERRYAFLLRAAAPHGARVAVAHHATDRLETLLAQLLRGAGPHGLSRPRAGREDGVVRPLFDRTADEVRAFLEGRGIAWREDPTNGDGSNLRARLRAGVIPLLRRENPEIDRVAARSVDLLAAASDHLEAVADAALADLQGTRCSGRLPGEICLAGPRGRAYDRIVLSTVLRRAIHRLGGNPSEFGFEALDRCARAWRHGAAFAVDLGGGFRISGNGDTLRLRAPSGSDPRPLRGRALPVPGELSLPPPGAHLKVDARPAAGALAAARTEGPRVAWLDASSVRGRLRVRGRRPGDRYRPLGLRGTVKVQDLMVNRKVPRHWRESVPIVEDEEGIVWIPGFRVDARTRITEETERALRLELTGPAPWFEES